MNGPYVYELIHVNTFEFLSEQECGLHKLPFSGDGFLFVQDLTSEDFNLLNQIMGLAIQFCVPRIHRRCSGRSVTARSVAYYPSEENKYIRLHIIFNQRLEKRLNLVL